MLPVHPWGIIHRHHRHNHYCYCCCCYYFSSWQSVLAGKSTIHLLLRAQEREKNDHAQSLSHSSLIGKYLTIYNNTQHKSGALTVWGPGGCRKYPLRCAVTDLSFNREISIGLFSVHNTEVPHAAASALIPNTRIQGYSTDSHKSI